MLCQLNEQEDERFLKHTVQLHDTFYTLKSQYNVSRRELVYYNSFLKGSIYLHNFHGREILIPKKDLLNNNYNSIKVALLLPFNTNLIDTSLYQNNNLKISDLHYKQYKSLDFYKGFLFSINEYTEKGNYIDLYVYDTYQNTDSVKVLLDSLKNMDLIIGPMYQKNFNIVKDFFMNQKHWWYLPTLIISILPIIQTIFFLLNVMS